MTTTHCRICSHAVELFISFGPMPIANRFLTPDQLNNEYFFELAVGFCPQCTMVQLIDQPDKEMMFHQEYAFFSSTSKFMEKHFERFAQSVCSTYLKNDQPQVMELGCNDGIMLKNFHKQGIKHLGIEPSSNVADVARSQGLNVISEFFDDTLAKRIKDEHGLFDAITAANIMCHVPNICGIAKGIKILLKPNGVFIFEDPYLIDILKKISYDQIYDEHVFYFSLTSIKFLFEQYDLQLVDAIPQDVHGGSMRYVIGHKDSLPIHKHVTEQLEIEKSHHIKDLSTYKKFKDDVFHSRDQLKKILSDIKNDGHQIVGYGATSKSTTVTNFCGITPEHLDYICDTTPIKQGKLNPGTHIPIKKYEQFKQDQPPYTLLFAWNHQKEIMQKEVEYSKTGKWIIYVPEVALI